jgi:hypothetical protein
MPNTRALSVLTAVIAIIIQGPFAAQGDLGTLPKSVSGRATADGVTLDDATDVLVQRLTGMGVAIDAAKIAGPPTGIKLPPLKSPPSKPNPPTGPTPSPPPPPPPAPPPPPPTPDPPPPTPGGPGVFHPTPPWLETYRRSTEAFRERLETQRKGGILSAEDYAAGVSKYKGMVLVYQKSAASIEAGK